MVPPEGLRLEHRNYDNGENGQRDGFLYDFQLDKIEWASVLHGTNTVGGNHEGILEQGDTPRHQDDENERPAGGNLHLTQLEVAVPGKSHKNVGNNKQ